LEGAEGILDWSVTGVQTCALPIWRSSSRRSPSRSAAADRAMAWYWVALILFGSALGLILLGIPVAIGFFITNVIAAVMFMGGGPDRKSVGEGTGVDRGGGGMR